MIESVVGFFSNYLIGRYMQYRWNSFISSLFQTGVRVEQGSFLSPILSALYLVPILKIWEKRSKNLTIPISTSILSFVNNGLFISQEKNFKKMNTTLFTCFNILSSILQNFGLAIKHNKTEVFHFTQATKNTDLRPLDLSIVRALKRNSFQAFKHLI